MLRTNIIEGKKGVAFLFYDIKDAGISNPVLRSRTFRACTTGSQTTGRRYPWHLPLVAVVALLMTGIWSLVWGDAPLAAQGHEHRQLGVDEMLLEDGRVYRQHLAGYELALPGPMISVPTQTVGERLFIRVDEENRPLYAVSVSFELIAEAAEGTYLYDRLEAAILTAADRLNPLEGFSEEALDLGHTETLLVNSFEGIRQGFALPAPGTDPAPAQQSGRIHHLIQVVEAGWRGIILLAAGTGSTWDEYLPEILHMFDSLRID